MPFLAIMKMCMALICGEVPWQSGLALWSRNRWSGARAPTGTTYFYWETLSVHQVARGYLIQFREGSNAAGGRDGLRLPYVVPLKR